MLTLLILTTTVPNALAPANPGLALWLAPDHTKSLLQVADQQRTAWLALARPLTAANPNLPPLTPAETKQRAALAAALQEGAERVLAREPHNATAHRLLGELAEDPDLARQHMRTALHNSRREWIAAVWLLYDAYARKEPGDAITTADQLLRAHPQRMDLAMPVLAALSEDAPARAILASTLAQNPPWRREFLRRAPRFGRDGRTTLALLLDLKAAGSPPTPAEQEPFVNHLVGVQQGELAYYTWLQFLPPEAQRKVRLVTNGGFDAVPDGLPFDWKISSKAVNVSVRLEDVAGGAVSPNRSRGRALHVAFSSGRVQFPAVEQLLALAPGRYELTGQQRIDVLANRGLRWRLSCVAKGNARLGETDLATGLGRAWTTFAITVDVPADGCPIQRLQLVHDARSASEQFAKGEAWFDDLALRWVSPAEDAP